MVFLRADLEGVPPPPKIISDTIFYYNIVYLNARGA